MQSFWDYLRIRSRDAVLAGFQEATEIIEGTDPGPENQDSARRFLERHQNEPGKSPGPVRPEGRLVAPAAENPVARDGEGDGDKQTWLTAVVTGQMRDDVQRPDAFERRLDQTNPALAPPPGAGAARKRGRPRKNP